MWLSVRTAGACSHRSCWSVGIPPTPATPSRETSRREPSRRCWSTSTQCQERSSASCRRISRSCLASRRTSSRWVPCAVLHRRRIVGDPVAAEVARCCTADESYGDPVAAEVDTVWDDGADERRLEDHAMTIEELVPLTNGLTVTACGNTLVCDRARITPVRSDAIDMKFLVTGTDFVP